MKFQGIFQRVNGSLGSVISDAPDVPQAMHRTIFDATYCSPWTPDDITVLRIDDYLTQEILYTTPEWESKNIKSIFG